MPMHATQFIFCTYRSWDPRATRLPTTTTVSLLLNSV